MPNFNDIFKQMAETFTASIDDANARAAAAERRETDFRAQVSAVFAAIANDNGTPPSPPALPFVNAADQTPRRRFEPKYSDALFLDALTHDWQTITQVSASLAVKGHKITRNTIVTRLGDLVIAGAIEADDTGHRVRLIVPYADNDVAAPAPEPEPKPKSKVARKAKASAAPPIVAANDVAADLQRYAIPRHVSEPLLIKGDGLALLRSLPANSVDLVQADLPYGMTGICIDPVIDVDAWLQEMHRVVTDRGAIVAFSAQPFTTKLMNASKAFDRGIEMFFKQELIWNKEQPTGFQQSGARHLKDHENILIFSKGTVISRRSDRQMIFNPQGASKVVRIAPKRQRTVGYLANQHSTKGHGEPYDGLKDCPRSVIYGSKDAKHLHSFQKPLWLLDYLTLTFSNPGALVLDPSMGSGTAGVAAVRNDRRFIGAENGVDRQGNCIYSIAKQRIDDTAMSHTKQCRIPKPLG